MSISTRVSLFSAVAALGLFGFANEIVSKPPMPDCGNNDIHGGLRNVSAAVAQPQEQANVSAVVEETAPPAAVEEPKPEAPAPLAVITTPEREPRLGDDCLLVYLDVGANIGVHTRFLFEPNKYPDAQIALGNFGRNFGWDRDNRDICSFGFEPNPAHKARHEELERVYQSMGWRYKYIQAGASDAEGELTFWHKHTKGERRNEEWGFGMVKQHDDDTPENVPLVHLGKWIRHHILERRLPETIHGNYDDKVKQNGKVVMKLDIEGAEYAVLPNLVYSGVLCQAIDFAFGEQHPWAAQHFVRPPVAGSGKGAIKPISGKIIKKYFRTHVMNEAFMSLKPDDCKATWAFSDEEAYVHDGMDWPTPPQQQQQQEA